jgi:para-aminobenzoate synthetase/4-amino-4-deoxychorismate lyase
MIEYALIREREDWLRFTSPVEVIVAHEHGEVLDRLREVERGVDQRQLYAAGFVAYEAAPAFDAAFQVQPSTGALPLMLFGLFERPERLSRLPRNGSASYSLGEWRPTLGQDAYRRAVERIRKLIARGDTYQVNYTFGLRAPFEGDPYALFVDAQQAQQAAYAAYLELDGHAICSASPELFLRLEQDRLVCRPMKGTAVRGHSLDADREQMRWLASSAKNRAENLMIVDMVRNDLGRVAEIGSVEVPSPFDVERYPTLLQMTSTVAARSSAPMTEILAALFPSASITGAPKVRTMEIISKLENAPRGVYTGAIGFIAPDRRAQFNVAIRTAVIDRAEGSASYCVGGGIVWDSKAAEEYAECRIKARILTRPPPDFDLLETLLWRPGRGYYLLDLHLHRLRDAAAYFVRPCDTEQIRARLEELAEGLPTEDHRVRLLVAPDGVPSIETHALRPDAVQRTARIDLAGSPVHSRDPFLHFKTTHREVYDRALESRPGCDDVLLYNERGELTESCFANLVLRRNGRLLTPPLHCGLLAGTFRSELLARGEISEQILRVDELDDADEILLINSVRQWMGTIWAEQQIGATR